MKNSHSLGIFLICAIFLIHYSIFAQDNWWKDKKYKSESVRVKFTKCKKVFIDIGDGFSYNNLYSITPYFENEIYLNITGEDKGYYSSDQAKYILDSFLNNFICTNFKWRNSSRSDIYAFATGKFKYTKNGYSNAFDISISLNYNNESWLIDQIIIN